MKWKYWGPWRCSNFAQLILYVIEIVSEGNGYSGREVAEADDAVEDQVERVLHTDQGEVQRSQFADRQQGRDTVHVDGHCRQRQRQLKHNFNVSSLPPKSCKKSPDIELD